jgi:hypothetical protein
VASDPLTGAGAATSLADASDVAGRAYAGEEPRPEVSSIPSHRKWCSTKRIPPNEEDPADPNGKRFVGSAIWRTEIVTPAGQPPELAIRADIEVPERKLAMTFSFRRNIDKGLPATHTVEVTFKLPAVFPAASQTFRAS